MFNIFLLSSCIFCVSLLMSNQYFYNLVPLVFSSNFGNESLVFIAVVDLKKDFQQSFYPMMTLDSNMFSGLSKFRISQFFLYSL